MNAQNVDFMVLENKCCRMVQDRKIVLGLVWITTLIISVIATLGK